MNDFKLESALDDYYNNYCKNKNMMMLDAQEQYSPSKWSPRLTEDVIVGSHIKEFKSPLHRTAMDIYYPASYTKGTQIFMFIHGGYWQECGLDQTGSFAKSVTDMGLIYVGVSYDLCPDVSMSTIISQVQEAFRFVRHRFPFTNGFHVMGHSAGAHLATMIMAQPAHDFPELLPITLYPVSGIFDLRPLLNTDVNDALKLDMQLAEDLSPMNGVNFKIIYGNSRRSAKYCIIHAENDSPAFHEQSRRFYEMLKATGVRAELIKVENTDHFDIVERAIEPNFVLNQVISNEINAPAK